MTTTINLTPAEAPAWRDVPAGGTFWLVRDAVTNVWKVPMGPPVEFVQACTPCETCSGQRRSPSGLWFCPDCRIELVGPCETCGGDDDFCPVCLGDSTVVLGHAYAVGQPLPIVLCGSGHGLVGEYVVVENARVFRIKNASLPVTSDELTAALAHYGPPESLVGKWALELRRA